MEAEIAKSTLIESLAEHLLEFFDHLRRSGFDIGIRQYALAQDVLVVLAANNQLPCDPERLRNWLAPIICASPKDQETFYREFAGWLDQHPDVKATLVGVDSRASKPLAIDEEIQQSGRSKAWIVLASVLIIAACAFAAFYVAQIIYFPATLPSPPRTLTGLIVADSDTRISTIADASVSTSENTSVSDDHGQFSLIFHPEADEVELTVSHNDYEPATLSVNATDDFAPLIVKLKKAARQAKSQEVQADSLSPEDAARFGEIIARINLLASDPAFMQEPEGWRLFYRRYYKWIRASAAGVPLFCFGIWWLIRSYNRRLMLKKQASKSASQLDRLTVNGANEKLFSGDLFRRTIQKFRLHDEVISSDLDALSTVEVTVKYGGWFKPVYGLRNVMPEYLALIDCASFKDQQARLVDAIVDRLVEDGVFVQRYYFDGDPRACRKKDPRSRRFSLPDLAAKYPEHRLMIFSDGAGFINPLTRMPQRFLEMFLFWKDRALFTPQSPSHWGYREWAFAGSEFLVLPATEAGLDSFVETINTGLVAQAKGEGGASQFPEMLRDDAARWLLVDDPGPRVKDRLCAQLRHYLGDDGYYWFSACAVYPLLQWDITLFLGYNLAGAKERLLDEEVLLSLVRLPWFRHGTMPDWLRLRLIADLSSSREQAVRNALEQLLLSAMKHPTEGAQLEIARETNRHTSRLRKKKLEEILPALPEDSPSREHVFLSFISGHRPSKISVRLPHMLRQFFFKEGIRILGLRPAAMATMASVVAVAGWIMMAYFKPQLSTVSLIPSFTYVSEEGGQSEPLIGPVFARSDKAFGEYADLLIRQNKESLGSLIQHFLPNFSALQPETLLEDNSSSFQIRSDLYKEWLKEELKEKAEIDADAFKVYETRWSESSDWKSKLLYLTPHPPQVALVSTQDASTRELPSLPASQRAATSNAKAVKDCLNLLAKSAAADPLINYQGLPSDVLSDLFGVIPGKYKCALSDSGQRTKIVELSRAWRMKDAAKVRSILQEMVARSNDDSIGRSTERDTRSGGLPVGDSADKQASLRLSLVDVLGDKIDGRVSIRLRHQVLSDQRVLNDLDASKIITITNLFGIPQGLYRIEIDPSVYLPTSRFVTIKSSGFTDVEITLAIDPNKVRSVEFPVYSRIPAQFIKVLSVSDKVLSFEGRRGANLYNSLDDIRKANLLNIAAKSEATLLNNGLSVSYYIQKLIEIRGDRIFVEVPKDLRDAVKYSMVSGLWNLAPDTLHTPPPGYERAGSYKTLDKYGKLQITFFTDGKQYIADLNIDDAGGLEHLFQVPTRSWPSRQFHPYSIHDILIKQQQIDPGYRFITSPQGPAQAQ